MVPEYGNLKLYIMFLYHSSSEILHLHQIPTLGVTFYKTMKQIVLLFYTLLLRDHLKSGMKTTAETCPPLTQGDSLQIRIELTQAQIRAVLTCWSDTALWITPPSVSSRCCSSAATCVLWQANHPPKHKRTGQKTPIKRKHMKNCDAFTFLGALEDKS